MKQLSKQEIKKLGIFNNKLKILEEKIYNICLEYNQTAIKKILDKENNIIDYELKVVFYFYGSTYMINEQDDEHLIAHWADGMKRSLMTNELYGINDNQCHNITSVFQKDTNLNSQKHCWLLHSLYDHCHLDWDVIFKIDEIYFDVEVKYDYEYKEAS